MDVLADLVRIDVEYCSLFGVASSLEDELSDPNVCSAAEKDIVEKHTLLKPRALPAESTVRPPLVAALAPLPERIGPYKILQELGSGGQSVVYRAFDTRLEREVALKWSHFPQLTDDERDTLAAEGKILAALDHPCLARVYDLGFHDGQPYLAMEYVPGRHLKQAADQQQPAPREAAALIAAVARALAVVHARGVVHRDLKPQNIIVDEQGRPRIIDFGLARAVHAWSAAEGTELISGTLLYMAPEQAVGTRADPRSDVYALGAVLYFLLTGKAPFQPVAPVPLKVILGRVVLNDYDDEALEKSAAPRSLKNIVRRAMATRPENRYPTAAALADALEAFPRRRKRIFAALLSVAIAAGIGIGVWQLNRPDPSTVPPQVALKLSVSRAGQWLELPAPVPLQSGDQLRIHVHVPRGSRAVLYAVNAAGKPQRLHEFDAAREGIDVPYSVGALAGSTGTELVLLAGRRDGDPAADPPPAVWAAAADWPGIPTASVARIHRDGVQWLQRTRDIVPSSPGGQNAEAEIERRLQQLRAELLKHFETIDGIVFFHGE